LEFTLAGIPVIFLMTSTVQMGIGMWNYYSLARAVNQTARFASLRGSDCSSGANSCGTTVGALTTMLATKALGVPRSSLNVTLVTDSGAVTTCNPVTNCTANPTAWPPSTQSDNARGKKVTITAQYAFQSGLVMFWPGVGGAQVGTVNFPASSTQLILF
jgi:Flp pilus assembly protein TadG